MSVFFLILGGSLSHHQIFETTPVSNVQEIRVVEAALIDKEKRTTDMRIDGRTNGQKKGSCKTFSATMRTHLMFTHFVLSAH
jgi:hypothetical protein